MSVLVSFTPRASESIAEASAWWRDKNPAQFREELEAALSLISAHPDVGESYDLLGLPGIRRRLLRKTKYYLYYRRHPLHPDTALQVVLLWPVLKGDPPPLEEP